MMVAGRGSGNPGTKEIAIDFKFHLIGIQNVRATDICTFTASKRACGGEGAHVCHPPILIASGVCVCASIQMQVPDCRSVAKAEGV